MADTKPTTFSVDVDTSKQSGIYQIRNLLDDKVYIGSAFQFGRRWRSHQSLLRRGVHYSERLQNEWVKHGSNAFVFEILEFIPDRTKIASAEQGHIDRSRCCDPTFGYNVNPRAWLMPGGKRSPETCAKLAAANRGKKATPETCAKIGAGHLGKKLSPESIAKRTAKQKGLRRTLETRLKLSIASRGNASRKGHTNTPQHRARISMGRQIKIPQHKPLKDQSTFSFEDED